MPAWHEDNPYIKDELYFANVTQIGKKDFFYTIRRTNDFVAITLGSMLSCFLFYLITHRLPTHFKLYKKMLLLGWGIDTIVLINTFLIQSRVRSFNTYVLITFSGAVSWLGASTFCYVNVVQFSGSAVACAILPVQFYYRYFTLKTHYPLSNRHLVLCLCFSIAFVLPLSLNVSYLYCADKYDPNPDKLDLSSYWFPEAPIPPVIVSQSRSFNNAVQRIYGGVVFFAYYLISVFLAWKTMQLLREKVLWNSNQQEGSTSPRAVNENFVCPGGNSFHFDQYPAYDGSFHAFH
ncbi:hypothetical protein M3Y97_00166000 [Aphelenchoides bicaudatus]|nr:hypothetical protein M3Y97_00166000 [Aphelenchoides bicaudatus]